MLTVFCCVNSQFDQDLYLQLSSAINKAHPRRPLINHHQLLLRSDLNKQHQQVENQ